MIHAVLLASTIGNIFKPLYEAMAWLLAFFYRIVPNYAVAIALLTIFVMAVTAPLTIKSTKSMAAMQRLGPELKKIQQKYKGDRNRLNEEMMKLYKEHGVNPAGGCLPMLLQFPVFIVLYGVIRGLTNTVGPGKPLPYTLTSTGSITSKPSVCREAVCALP
ncbi:MAG TPA: membrane protein insertase YidC, partial [Acidimicrobiales bacterium]|nr:membrane protein insertase YidC [Acidimicrobiales bacterium]